MEPSKENTAPRKENQPAPSQGNYAYLHIYDLFEWQAAAYFKIF